MKKPQEVLKQAYKEAEKVNGKNQFAKFDTSIRQDIDLLIKNISENKSIVSALVTSLLKKIINPEQDIRLHRTDFNNGYSARSLDTEITTPFFKDKFPRYANKETSFLTLSTRERIKWTKKEGNALKIRNKALKESFLNVFENIEERKQDPNKYLVYIFARLIELTQKDNLAFKVISKQFDKIGTLNINLILKMLKEHFSLKHSSRLPVIAIYSIYEILILVFKRYQNKKLLPLQVHTSSDKHGYGDIEVYDNKGQPFEIVEIKHKIPLDKKLIFDVIKKTEKTKIDRYYILTTYKSGFESKEELEEVTKYTLQLKKQGGIDIIPNGIIPTLKYYLRFIDDYKLFIESYSNNLVKDAKNSTEVKPFHIRKWNNILEKYGLD